MSSSKMVSKFSATQIGVVDPSSDRHRDAREVYKKEALEISKALEANHHTRRLKNMQVYYPDTITKLSHVPSQQTLRPPQQQQETIHHQLSQSTIMREQEFYRTRSEQTQREHDFNNRKLMYNKECGRKAQVSNIICGRAPPAKEMLFPQGATHQQILALTNSSAAPDARKMPPPVPRPKKWLGDDKGWST